MDSLKSESKRTYFLQHLESYRQVRRISFELHTCSSFEIHRVDWEDTLFDITTFTNYIVWAFRILEIKKIQTLSLHWSATSPELIISNRRLQYINVFCKHITRLPGAWRVFNLTTSSYLAKVVSSYCVFSRRTAISLVNSPTLLWVWIFPLCFRIRFWGPFLHHLQ